MDLENIIILVILALIIGGIVGAFIGLIIPLVKSFFTKRNSIKRIQEQEKDYKYILDGKPYNLLGEIKKELNNTSLMEKEERAGVAKVQTYKKEVEETPINPPGESIISPRVKKKRGRPKKYGSR
jgi:hypothetical protein